MKQEILQLTGGNFKEGRRELDFYPTPKEVTIALLDFLNIPLGRLIWEPACGNGAMSNVIKSYGYEVVETDIVTGQDYLTTKRDCDVIITNPPFNLSEQFIRKAVSEANLVCMLVKSQYWHASKRLKLFEDTSPKYILPLTWRPDFLEHTRKEGDKKGSPTMEVCWVVWSNSSNSQCIYHPLKKPV